MSRDNPLKRYSDDELVAEHTVQAVNNHFVTEMLRRHKDSAEAIGQKIESLNKRLLVFTIVIAVFTVVIAALTLVPVFDVVRQRLQANGISTDGNPG